MSFDQIVRHISSKFKKIHFVSNQGSLLPGPTTLYKATMSTSKICNGITEREAVTKIDQFLDNG